MSVGPEGSALSPSSGGGCSSDSDGAGSNPASPAALHDEASHAFDQDELPSAVQRAKPTDHKEDPAALRRAMNKTTTLMTRERSSTTVLPVKMRQAVLQAAAHTSKVLQHEAVRATCMPMKLRHVHLMETSNDVTVHMYKPRVRTAEQPHARSPQDTARVIGTCQIHAPIGEVVDIIGHKSQLSFALLNPGLQDYNTLHTLVNAADEFVALKSVAMSPHWHRNVHRPREFTVMEYQQAFTTRDGRRGWVVSYHSITWSSCPPTELGAVRGSVYRSGIVVLESLQGADRLELFAVAEFNLKGQASTRVNRDVARDRVVDSLVLLTATIEQRAVSELALLQTHDFNELKRQLRKDTCRICVAKPGAVPKRGGKMHRCRKCCISVCDSCSSIWRRGKKEMRLCMDCWGEATLHQF